MKGAWRCASATCTRTTASSDVTLSLCVNNVVRGAWGAALLNLELYDLHVRPLVARIAAKQKTAGGTARDAVREASAFLEEKVRKKPSPHWDVLLRWASSTTPSSSGAWGLGDPASRSGPGRTSRRRASTRRSRGRRRRPTRHPKSILLTSVTTRGGHKTTTPRVEWRTRGACPGPRARRCGSAPATGRRSPPRGSGPSRFLGLAR